MTSDGQPYFRVAYKNIIQEQVTIGFLSKGGITYGDTEDMSPYDRKIALETLTEIIENQRKQISDATGSKQNFYSKDPKSRLTSGG